MPGALQLAADVDQAGDLFFPVAHRFHRIEEIGAEETDAHHLQIAAESDPDLIGHGGGGGGGQSEHRRVAQLGQRLGNEEIVGPEIGTPEIDAMGFVDDGEGDRHPLQRAQEAVIAEALRGDIDQLGGAVANLVQPVLGFLE